MSAVRTQNYYIDIKILKNYVLLIVYQIFTLHYIPNYKALYIILMDFYFDQKNVNYDTTYIGF